MERAKVIFLFAALVCLSIATPTFASTSAEYTYDNLNRITQATYDDGTVIKYTYDASGNRLAQAVTGGTNPSATHFTVSAPSSATAGTAVSFTVTALDASNHTVTGYPGTVHFTSTDGSAALPSNATLTNGTGTFSATLNTGGSQTITATDTGTSSITGTSNTITVASPSATHFTVSAPTSATAGTAVSFTVTALDASNHTVAGYAGTVHFTSTDGSAALPSNATLTNGTGTFSAALNTAGSQTITATDTAASSITGTSNAITVSLQTGSLTVTIGPPAAVDAGAMWSVDGGSWQISGAAVSNLSVGSHTVGFKDVQGWTTPSGQTANVSNGQTASATGTYTPVFAAGFTASRTSGKAPLAVHFTYSSTGSVTKCLWNFGDGKTSKVPNPSHTYSKPGSYTVTLTVTGAWGKYTCTQPNYITVYTAPKANFSGAPKSGKAPLQVNFTDESTGLVTSWLWHFGDGTTSTEKSPNHTYNSHGTFTAKLTVYGPGGTGSKTLSIRVTPAAPTTVPGAPTGVNATAGNAQAWVTFSPPASNGGSAITFYTVTSNPGGITASGASSPITVPGLTNGAAYTFTVRATNAVGTGPVSGISNSVTPANTGNFIVVQPGVVKDSASGLTWYSNMAAFVNETYSAQMASVNQLNISKFGGISTWHIATWAETNTLMANDYAQIMAVFSRTYIWGTTTVLCGHTSDPPAGGDPAAFYIQSNPNQFGEFYDGNPNGSSGLDGAWVCTSSD